MPLAQLGKFLLAAGLLLVVTGGILILAARLGGGNLPGDFSWRKGSVQIYAPLATCIILSIVATVVLNLVARFFR